MHRRRSIGDWIAEQKRTYFENATAMRDFRVQMRGNRPPLIFGGYLLVLMLVAGITYWSIANNGSFADTLAGIQQALNQFYESIVATIAAMLFVIAPALTATAVVSERSRKSLDLVFCAPVEPKYFLVGKLVASYRYVWMLLFLSIPVTATCVVFGGASWVDVLLNYLQLSLLGMMVTALSLCVSTVAQKPVAAILWSYMGSAGLLSLLGLIGGSAPESSALSALSPLGMLYSSGRFVSLGAIPVPAFVITIAVTGLISKLLLHAAGNLLAPHNPRSAMSLRIHALLYSWATVGIGTGIMASSLVNQPRYDGGPEPATQLAMMIGVLLGYALMLLCTLMPMISTFSLDDERVHRPNGWFNLRRILTGTPASALPYLYLFIGGCFAAAVTGAKVAGATVDMYMLAPFVAYSLGLWSFMWALGRAASVMRPNITEARTVQFLAFLITVVLPAPFLGVMQSLGRFGASGEVWNFYILKPLIPISGSNQIVFGSVDVAWTAGVWILAALTFVWSEAKMRDRRRYQLPHSIEAFGEESDEPWIDSGVATPAQETAEIRLNA